MEIWLYIIATLYTYGKNKTKMPSQTVDQYYDGMWYCHDYLGYNTGGETVVYEEVTVIYRGQ